MHSNVITAQTKMDFASQLSKIRHDLRTPVGHIIGYSEMLQEDLGGDMKERTSDDLHKIKQAGERLLSIIEKHFGASKDSIGEIDFWDAERQLRGQLEHVLGNCDILRKSEDDGLLKEIGKDLGRIESAANTFMRMLANIEPALQESTRIDSEASADSVDAQDHETAANFDSLIVEMGGSILMVDDDAVNRDLISRRLTPHGYSVTSVGSGDEALALLADSLFDLILLDYSMPGMSGIEVLKALKGNARLMNVPVIMLSATDDTNQVVKCILKGAEDYLFKPFNPILLRARVAASLEKHRLRRRSSRRLTVFVSSPGDVIPERQAVKRAIRLLNNEFDGRANLVPVLFEEEPLVASETFQSQIISPKDTDIYVGIFWARMGTPLPAHITREDGSTYGSGSEYEFEDAMTGCRNCGKPDILVYQKTADVHIPLTNRAEVLEAVDQKERLDLFLSECFRSEDDKSYVGAFHVFPEVEHFEELVLGHLRKLVVKKLSSVSGA